MHYLEAGEILTIHDQIVAAIGGALYEALCNYPVFIDGNKRAAAISMYRFLVINQYNLTATNHELETFTLQIATSHPDLAEVATWINHHSAPVKPG